MKKLNYLICLLIVFTFLFPEYNFAKDNRNNPNKKKTEKTLPESNESVQTTIKVLDPDDDSAKEIINIFLENSPRRFLDPGAPRFAVEGKDKKYYFGIGGFVKGTAAYDFGNPIESPVYFSPSRIPMNGPVGNGGLFQMTLMSSCLFFNFVALPNNKNQIGAYINFNLTEGNYGFFLQYAYIKWNGFIVGYNFTNFSNSAVCPPSVDTEGLPSFTNVRTSQFCYTYLHKRWSYSIGIENPIVSYTTNNHTSFVNQRAPQIPAYIQYTWGYANESSVRLSGIVRNMQYRDLLQNKNHNMTGWGVQLSGQAILNRIVTLYYQGVYGKGVGNLIQDINGIGIDLVPATSESGKLKAPKAFGFYGGIKFNYSSKLFSTHMYSQVRDYAKYYSNGTMDWNQQYKYGQDLVNNLFYVYNSMIILGIEYDWGRKTIMSGEKRNDNRIQAMVQFSF